jgi:uncharacterized membrane protein
MVQFLEYVLFPTAVILALDAVYLSATRTMYEDQVRRVQKSAMVLRLGSVVACYALVIFGLVWFILLPGRPVLDAFLLGLVVYGVYETTTYSILTQWDFRSVAIDTVWGAVLMATTTWITYRVWGMPKR